MKTEKRALPFMAYFIPTVGLGVVGLLDSIYLSFSHYRVHTDIGYKSFCAVSRAINCDTVSQSPYAIFLGVPLPIWGVVGYLIVLFFLWKARHTPTKSMYFWPTLFFISISYSIYSVVLGLISSFMIKSYCLMCILSYVVNFLLVLYSWIVHDRFQTASIYEGIKKDFRLYWQHRKKISIYGLIVASFLVIMIVAFPNYWAIQSPNTNVDIPHGITEDGHPWIGAANPDLIITEFSDYQCFQCKKMHFYLREIIAAHPDKIRLVHRHFPMDDSVNPIVKQPFHIGSGKLALLALFAQEKGKFWEINDLFYNLDARKDTFNIRNIANQMGFDVIEFARSANHPYFKRKLADDIREGIQRGVTGTPGFLIEDTIYLGFIPDHFLLAY